MVSTMFSYTSSQLHRLNPATSPGHSIPVFRELGILCRPRYIHRGLRKFSFHNQKSCSDTNIPSLWSSVARLSRHQSTVALATTNIGNIAGSLQSSMGNTTRSPYSQLDGFHGMDSSLRGVDFNVLRPVQRFTPQSLVKFKLFNTQSINNKSTLIEEHIREK